MSSRPRPSLPRKSLPALGAGLLTLCAPAASRAADPPVVHLRFPVLFEPINGPLTVAGELRLSGPAAEAVTVKWLLTDGTARAGEDYTAASGEVTIPAGAVSAPVELTLLADTLSEGDETLLGQVTVLSGPAAAEAASEWTLRDTDRPAIVYAPGATAWENAPPVDAEVSVYPSGGPFTFTAHGFAPDVSESVEGAAALGYALPGPEWPTTPVSVTASARGVVPLPLTGTEDAVLDGNRRALVRFSLPPGAVSASFSERLVHTQAGTVPSLEFQNVTTDGDWVAAARFSQDSSAILIHGRDPAASGGWRLWESLPPSLAGRTDWRGVFLKLRRGRLLIFESATGKAWFLRAPVGEETNWAMEATQSAPPAANEHVDFDGETLVVGVRLGQLIMVNRGDGNWTGRQTVGLTGDNPGSLAMALNNGLLAWHLPSQTPNQGVNFLQRMGRGPSPWVALPASASLPPVNSPDPVYRIFMDGNVAAVNNRLYRRGDDGAWTLEQSLPDWVSHLSRGILLSELTLMADTGNAAAPWQPLGAGSSDLGWPRDFCRGVWVSVLTPFNSAPSLKILEPGLGFPLMDEDSFLLTPQYYVSFAEPSNSAANLIVQLNTFWKYTAPADIRVPFETVAGGTAVEGLDYRPVRGELVIPKGSDGASLGIPILPDAVVEGTETIRFKFGAPSYGRVPASSAEPELSVTEDPPGFIVPTPPVSVSESAEGEAVYRIPFSLTSATRAPSESVQVRYRVQAGTASAADALLTEEGTATLPADTRTVLIPLTVYADDLTEEPESVRITITGAGPHTGTFAVVDVTLEDRPSPETTPDSYTVDQNAALEPSPERNVLANDTAGNAAANLSAAPRPGAVTLNADGTFRYTPAPNFIGQDRFSYSSSGFALPADHPWKWVHPREARDPGAGWPTAAFDDSSWKNGFGLMGYGSLGFRGALRPDTDIGTLLNGRTAYFRSVVTLPAAPEPGVTIDFLCDDAAIFYLNGVEIARFAKEPIGDFATARDTFSLAAPNSVEDADEAAVRRLWLPTAQMLEGANTLAVSVHNATGPITRDLALRVLRLTPGRITPPVDVTVDVRDAGLPSVVVNDIAYPPQETGFPHNSPRLDSRLLDGSAYRNDGLLSATGAAYDPILEVETGGSPAGPVTFEKDTGHWVMDTPPGYYGRTSFTYRVRDKDGWSNTATVTISVNPTNPYAVWRLAKFGGDFTNPKGLPGGDDDGDGLANLLEYVLDRDAARSDAGEPLRVSRNGDRWELVFEVAAGFGVDTALALESSDSPAEEGWTRIAILDDSLMGTGALPPGVTHARTEIPRGTTPETYRARYAFTLPADSAPRRYYRLRALQEPTVLNP